MIWFSGILINVVFLLNRDCIDWNNNHIDVWHDCYTFLLLRCYRVAWMIFPKAIDSKKPFLYSEGNHHSCFWCLILLCFEGNESAKYGGSKKFV